MALRKTKSYKGIDLSYWCIISTTWNKDSGNTSAVVIPFKDSDSRADSLENALSQPGRVFTFENPTNSNGVQQFTLTQLYDLIKSTDDFFSDAEDC